MTCPGAGVWASLARHGAFAWALACFTFSTVPVPAATKSKAAGDDLFAEGVVPRLDIEIPPEGLKVLREYHQVWRQPRPERSDVQVTIHEGSLTYTNVAVHLKGSYTYQDIDQKP